MYVDESGDEGVAADQTKKSFYDDWFTTGGIIVEQANIVRFEQAHDSIMRNNFVNNDVKLPSSFKLHYHELRQNTYPYNSISDRQRWDIANAMFSSINSIDCSLVSATIYKPSHIAKYTWPINIRAYALLICLERFQYFLEEQGSEGTVIYERFNTRLRRKMSKEMDKLRGIPNFPFLSNLDRIKGKIKNGDPAQDRILQFSDFFVYAPHIKTVTNHEKIDRWNEIKDKYYLLNGPWMKRGFVVI